MQNPYFIVSEAKKPFNLELSRNFVPDLLFFSTVGKHCSTVYRGTPGEDLAKNTICSTNILQNKMRRNTGKNRDYENNRQHLCSRFGFSQEVERERTTRVPEPWIGGTRGYLNWYRSYVLQRVAIGGLEAVLDVIPVLKATVYRWIERQEPYQMTGNHERSVIVGQDLILLILANYIFLDATAPELAAWMYTYCGNVYVDAYVSSGLQYLCYTQKRASKEAYEAFEPNNLCLWNIFSQDLLPLALLDALEHH